MGFIGVVRTIYFAMLGYSAVEIGLLLSLATFLSAIHHITYGYLSDRYGRKPFLILGTGFAAARTAIFALSTDFWMLALAQSLGAMGEGAGAGQPVVSGYITDKVCILNTGICVPIIFYNSGHGQISLGMETWTLVEIFY